MRSVGQRGLSRAEWFAWFKRRLDKYPFVARAPTSVRPETVPGDHVSIGDPDRIGWRRWAFETAAERDQFCERFGGTAL